MCWEWHVIRGGFYCAPVGSGATGRRGREDENGRKRLERTRNRRSFDVAVVLPENTRNQYSNVQGKGIPISSVSGLSTTCDKHNIISGLQNKTNSRRQGTWILWP